MLSRYDFEKLFAAPTLIRQDFERIWSSILENVDDIKVTPEEAREAVKGLVLYDALDGSRTTLSNNPLIKKEDDVPLFSIALNHTLIALGARSSVIMVHTSYNRSRGEDDFNRVLSLIKSGMDLIRFHSLNNGINWRYICTNEEYELIDVLKEVEDETKGGDFKTYFLFDYNEEWYGTSDGFMALSELPDINVHVRHTKLNFSGGWIPGKMNRSTFLYSQNGSLYSNWEYDEIVALVAIALLAKLLNDGEGLNKMYGRIEEIKSRYKKRETDLFHKTIYLRARPRKLFICGSPEGAYLIYY